MAGRKLIKIGGCIVGERSSANRIEAPFSPQLARLREIEKVIRSRHGQFIPDPEDTDDRELCLDFIRAAAFSLAPQNMSDWCHRWAPWVRQVEVLSIEIQARRRRKMMPADGAAALLRLTYAERTKLKIMTIGACDITKSDRMKLAEDRKRELDRTRQRANRKAAGRQDRLCYEAASLSQIKPWEAVGISRSTWYRTRETGVSLLEDKTTGDTPVSVGDCVIPSEVAVGVADRLGVWGSNPQRRVREAEPHGRRDAPKEDAA